LETDNRAFTVKFEKPLLEGSVIALGQDGQVLEAQDFLAAGERKIDINDE
jgi:hypothetical protein